jgi:hypothetical protein
MKAMYMAYLKTKSYFVKYQNIWQQGLNLGLLTQKVGVTIT